MKLTISCQICGTILSVVEKDAITQEDLADYGANSSCTVVTNGVEDAQADIQVTMTVS